MTGLPCRCCGGRERVVPMAFGGRTMTLMTWLFIMLMVGSGEHSGADRSLLGCCCGLVLQWNCLAFGGGFVCGLREKGGFEQRT